MEREDYMELALALAREAAQAGEVPVGAVVVDGAGRILGRGRNRRQERHSAVHHAEIEAIEQACQTMDSWHLTDCTLYVTLEPCPMCAGAIINARVPRLVYGAKEPVTGSCGSVINLFEERYGHHPAIFGGVKADECAQVLQDFFHDLRNP
jgi:tRNA(adenine34) deaminase